MIPSPTRIAALSFLLLLLVSPTTSSVPRHDFLAFDTDPDAAQACYAEPLPALPPSAGTRTVPWGTPRIVFANGTTCCASLDEVRAGIDEVDAQIVALLTKRVAYVREATRFKATRASVDVPARDAQVVEGAVAAVPLAHLPQTVARAVFAAIINASVPFEECVFDSFGLEESANNDAQEEIRDESLIFLVLD